MTDVGLVGWLDNGIETYSEILLLLVNNVDFIAHFFPPAEPILRQLEMHL